MSSRDFDLGRRTFLRLMGAGGLATLSGCGNEPPKWIVSYPTPPAELIPGVPTWYASVCRECPAGCGTIVATREGRPIKIEGNPLHPVNKGALCARGQAALQSLYNPHRVKEPLRRDAEGREQRVGWDEVIGSIAQRLRALKDNFALDRAAVVTPRVPGALAGLFDAWAEEHPGLGMYTYEPISYEPLEKANEICFGRRVQPLYRIDKADLVVSFGADFLETWISPVEYSSGFAAMRNYKDGRIGTLVYVGSRSSLTAANADDRVFIKPGTYGALALGIIRFIVEQNERSLGSIVDVLALKRLIGRYDPATVYRLTGVTEDTVRHLARLLASSRSSLVLPGGVEMSGSNATRCVVATNILNLVLGNFGKTIEIPLQNSSPARRSPGGLSKLIGKMQDGEIELLMLCGVNPVYDLPGSSGFREALKRVSSTVCCSEVLSETSKASDYVLPVHHSLESWGDYVPRDGVYGLIQPAVRPLGDSKPLGEILIRISSLSNGDSSKLSGYETYHDFLMDRWRDLVRDVEPGKPFESVWEDSLRRGGLFKAPSVAPVILSQEALGIGFEDPAIEEPDDAPLSPSLGDDGRTTTATLLVYPSQVHYDGRGANKPWLQELPDPMQQNVWSSCIEVPAAAANEMRLQPGDVVRVTSAYGELESTALVTDHGMPGVVAIARGQGHWSYGAAANGMGVNPGQLLPFSFDELSGGLCHLRVSVHLAKTGRRQTIPTPQAHAHDEGRGIVQSISAGALREFSAKQQEQPEAAKHEFEDLLKPHDHPKHRWGMVIDLNACTGCSACVVACYAENNIPMVGKEQYLKGREMSWIRIERYFSENSGGGAQFLPMLCQQCDNAPCEPVCPVYATYHTVEGLNAQIYNRCVGTRYCANNCPYTVRRFNWHTVRPPEPLNLQFSPDVTVRTKGVMEKCTFCIQRIMLAKDRAKDEGRELRDGEIVPACAQTCPTKAITFGDLKDPASEVSRKMQNVRSYRVLEYLNTKPAITYLKKIENRWEVG